MGYYDWQPYAGTPSSFPKNTVFKNAAEIMSLAKNNTEPNKDIITKLSVVVPKSYFDEAYNSYVSTYKVRPKKSQFVAEPLIAMANRTPLLAVSDQDQMTSNRHEKSEKPIISTDTEKTVAAMADAEKCYLAACNATNNMISAMAAFGVPAAVTDHSQSLTQSFDSKVVFAPNTSV